MVWRERLRRRLCAICRPSGQNSLVGGLNQWANRELQVRLSTRLSKITSRWLRPPMRYRDASSSKCPRHHQREFFLPERATVRPISLIHDDIRMCTAQCVRPPPCVLQEERLLCASDKVYARKRNRHNSRRLVATARR